MQFRAVAVALALAFGTIAAAGSAGAFTLHGFCDTAAPCPEIGAHTPTGVNPPEFGFAASGHAQTGTVLIDILVPDNVTLPGSYTISGPLLGTGIASAALFSSTPWTSDDLASYLHLSASPDNPIGAYLPATKAYQPTADGFYVFEASLGSVTLPSNSDTSNDDLLTTEGLFPGSFIVAFQHQGDSWDATANSGAILETGPMPSVPEPATWALMVLGLGVTGFAARRRSSPALAA